MSRPIMAITSHNILFVTATHERACSALSSTYLHLTGGSGTLGKPDNPSLVTLASIAVKDPGTCTASPGTRS
jgi:hypothetical protein